VGDLRIAKPSRNVIPGEVWFTVDLRHPEEPHIEAMDAALREAVKAACEPLGLDAEVNQIWYFPPVAFDAACIAAVRKAAEDGGYSWREIVSGPGHDSCYTARVVPTSMIFIPCKDGLSHNEEEWTEPEQMAAGCDVLLRAAVEMAKA
jgi:N-carbamoyl-L-amino-acid hydrolase